ncbi:YigZ family protein [bacterium F16]|nr:YigZ family protein [bacterium F16]
MTVNYTVPARKTRVDLKIKKSRFIATAAYTPSVDEAKEFIADIKQEFSDATHNVPAYIIGNGASSVEQCRDDGEPGGTAGRPMLAVLKGSGLGDITVVVSRYFGGTKLGTGGLVQAYGHSVKEVLNALPRARKTTIITLNLRMPYSHYEPVKRAAQMEDGVVSNEEFAVDVRFDVAFELPAWARFRIILADRWPTRVDSDELGEDVGILPDI